MRAGKNQIDQL